MGTKNFWVLCVSMCLGVFGVYSCGDDELENTPQNSPQEEVKDVTEEDSIDTLVVQKDTTVMNVDTTGASQEEELVSKPSIDLDSCIKGEWLQVYGENPYENPYDEFHELIHSFVIWHFFDSHGGMCLCSSEYYADCSTCRDNVEFVVRFKWEVTEDNILEINFLEYEVVNECFTADESRGHVVGSQTKFKPFFTGGVVRYALSEISESSTSKSLYFNSCGYFYSGTCSLQVCDGEDIDDRNFSVILQSRTE